MQRGDALDTRCHDAPDAHKAQDHMLHMQNICSEMHWLHSETYRCTQLHNRSGHAPDEVQTRDGEI